MTVSFFSELLDSGGLLSVTLTVILNCSEVNEPAATLVSVAALSVTVA